MRCIYFSFVAVDTPFVLHTLHSFLSIVAFHVTVFLVMVSLDILFECYYAIDVSEVMSSMAPHNISMYTMIKSNRSLYPYRPSAGVNQHISALCLELNINDRSRSFSPSPCNMVYSKVKYSPADLSSSVLHPLRF